jgi:hypothetical protein
MVAGFIKLVENAYGTITVIKILASLKQKWIVQAR